jgi:hypothetical protein
MWMLSFVPDAALIYFVNTILLVGAISSFITFFAINRLLRYFPALAPYYLLLQIVSAGLLVAGIYFKGGYDTESEWRLKVKEAQERAAIAEQKAEETNSKVQIKVVEKIKVVREVQVVNRDRIVKEKEIIDKDCKLAPQAVDIHNDAAKNRKPEASK